MDKWNNVGRVPLHPGMLQNAVKQKQTLPPKQSFLQHLQEASDKLQLKVSKHAQERLIERNITISDAEWQQVTDKVLQARKLGIKDSLVLMDKAALIVSAKNATVITAMDRKEANDQIFTNIDGTIVIN